MTPSSAAALHPGHRAARTPTLTATPSSPAPSLQTIPPPTPNPKGKAHGPMTAKAKHRLLEFNPSSSPPQGCRMPAHTHAHKGKWTSRPTANSSCRKNKPSPPSPVSMLRHGRDADRASPGQVGWKGPGQLSPAPQVSLTCHSCSDKLGLPLSDAVGCNCEICPATHSCPSSKLLPVRAHNQGIWSTLDDGIKH